MSSTNAAAEPFITIVTDPEGNTTVQGSNGRYDTETALEVARLLKRQGVLTAIGYTRHEDPSDLWMVWGVGLITDDVKRQIQDLCRPEQTGGV